MAEAKDTGPGHPTAAKVQERLLEFGVERVWCAAGTPHAVFEIETEALFRAVGAAE
ncbi:MAG: hypothetical protein HY511_02190 [Actinobacteria bacterium]|nr:hypothetical protein [Actinomycetota bacterium]